MIKHITYKNYKWDDFPQTKEIRYYPSYKALPERGVEYGKLEHLRLVIDGIHKRWLLKVNFGDKIKWVKGKYCSFVEEEKEVQL